MSSNEKSIRICPKCHGHNGDCAHCGGSGADDSREELNIIGAQKKDMARSKPKRPAGRTLTLTSKGFDLEKLDSPGLSNEVFEMDDGNPILSRWDRSRKLSFWSRLVSWLRR